MYVLLILTVFDSSPVTNLRLPFEHDVLYGRPLTVSLLYVIHILHFNYN